MRLKVLPEMAEKISKSIIDEIGNNFFSITSDGWQQPTTTPALLRFKI